MVKMVGNGAMCVVHRDLLVPSVGGGGGELGVGCRCDLGEEGEAQPAIILGAGQFNHILGVNEVSNAPHPDNSTHTFFVYKYNK